MSAEIFHAGERAMQARAGVGERVAAIGAQAIRNFMPEQHRDFFRQLPFIVVGTVDRAGQPWASMLAGPPGFVDSPDPGRLAIHAQPLPGSPLASALVTGKRIGLLGIEPHTRRRNRMNGVVARISTEGFEVEVQQSFGNCPKYIQARQAAFAERRRPARDPIRGAHLDADAKTLIGDADTFFIASAHRDAATASERAYGVDVSHRGGKPGFVRIDDDRMLTVPDFSGNNFFNTLGNLVVNPQAGLLFADYTSGDLLHVAVDTEIVEDGPEVALFAGAQRLLRLCVRETLRVPGALPLIWSAAELSPHLVPTGHW